MAKEATPALDLGENEIALDLDDNPSITPAPPVAAAPLDEVELSLEIDDSDDPLTIQSQDIPDLEIEDLGLELESSDDPAADKPLNSLRLNNLYPSPLSFHKK